MQPRFAIVASAASPTMFNLYAVTRPNHEAYAAKHGYIYASEVWEDGEKSWRKPGMLLELMLQNPDVPTVMWIDADAIFTNMGIVIPSRDGVIMACDVNGLNAGVMVMENSEPVRAMLYAAYTSGKALFAGGPWSDQMAIRYFLSGPPYSDLLRVVPQRYMNSYWPGAYVYPGCESAWWKDGDWILHLPGMSYDERMSVLVNLA